MVCLLPFIPRLCKQEVSLFLLDRQGQRRPRSECGYHDRTMSAYAARRRWGLLVLLGLVVTSLGLAAGGACTSVTSRLLLFPSRGEIDLGGAERRMVPDAEGAVETIRARSPGARTAPARAIVLCFYGNADRAERWVRGEADAFGSWPVEVWGVNYPGYGRSEGRATLAGVARAAEVVLAEAEKLRLPLYAMGTSMGSTAALHIAATGRLRGLFLHNPPPLAQLIRGRYGWWNLWLLAGPVSLGVPRALDSLANARKTVVPTLMLSSGRDEVVPFEYQTQVFEACAGPRERVVVAAARHNDPVPGPIWSRVRAVLKRQGWGP
jgi:pimeloyl-ACP methyl ester carboxylesterase